MSGFHPVHSGVRLETIKQLVDALNGVCTSGRHNRSMTASISLPSSLMPVLRPRAGNGGGQRRPRPPGAPRPRPDGRREDVEPEVGMGKCERGTSLQRAQLSEICYPAYPPVVRSSYVWDWKEGGAQTPTLK